MKRWPAVLVFIAVCGLALWWFALREPLPTTLSSNEGAISKVGHPTPTPKPPPPGQQRRGNEAGFAAQSGTDAPIIRPIDGGVDAGADHAGLVTDADGQAQARVEVWLDENAHAAERAIESFCATAAKVKRPVEPRGPEAARDARAFMEGKMDKEGIPPFIGALHLSDVIVDDLRAFGDDWFIRIEPRQLQGLDFGWMSALRDFDVWSGAAVDDQALPNYARMKWWVMLRLALGRLSGDFESAWADVDHFALLLRSQANLVAEVTSYQFMEIAEQARLRAARLGLRVPTSTVNYTELKSLSRAAPAFLYPRVSPATAKRALECFPPPCGVLAEAAGMQRILSQFGAAPKVSYAACAGLEDAAKRLSPLPASQALDYVSDDTPLRQFFR